MLARTTTFWGDAEAVDAGIAYVRDDGLPALSTVPGSLGMSLVVDRQLGRCVATSSWLTAEDRSASLARLASMRARGAKVFDASLVVEDWEVALMHRAQQAPEGTHCRLAWGRAADLDSLLSTYREQFLPALEQADGFCSASIFLSRPEGRVFGTVTVDSLSALETTRELFAQRRRRISELTGMVFDDVGEFELVLDTLRIPELA